MTAALPPTTMLDETGLSLSVEQQLPMPLSATLRCGRGELLVLVGPSGAGKTSLLRVIAGLLRPAQARIVVDDACWCDTSTGVFAPPQARHLGFVFQNYALMPHLSALDNVALSLLHLPRETRRRTAARWLEQCHLDDTVHRQAPDKLSGGQQQRVAVARALARMPRLLLLDEPFSAVDHATRRGLYDLLAELRQTLAIPIVLVTHDLAEARLLADRMAVMDAGKVLQTGTPAHIYRSPRNTRVADLMGAMNRFTGIWLGPDDATGRGLLRWSDSGDAGPLLRVPDKGKLPTGQTVHWLLPGEGIELLDAGASGPTTFAAELLSARHVGELSLCTLRLTQAPRSTVQLSLTGTRWRGLQPGTAVALRLDPDQIHVMPLRPHVRADDGRAR